MSKKVSVLMSVYNGSYWLHQSIPSVLSQTFSDFEFIIVNDGSTDASLEIMQEYAARDARIKILDKSNTGLADSLNKGIELAIGDWVARIDADDISMSMRLEKQHELAQQNAALVLIGSALAIINANNEIETIFRYPTSHQLLRDRLLKKRSFFAHSSAFYRRNIAKILGGYRPRIKRSQDFDLWLRFSEVGELACIDEPLVGIRKHIGQVSHEDGGERQLIDSRVALVSYHLRNAGVMDPVGNDSQDENFQKFRAFVEKKIISDGLLEYRNFIEKFKTNSANLSLKNAFSLFFYFSVNLRFFLRYLRERRYGENLSQKIAKKWINKNLRNTTR